LKKLQVLILDSSVIAKWIFLDEENAKALEIKNMFGAGQLSIAVPLLLFYEMNNILKSAVKSKRVKAIDALQALDDFLILNFTVYSSETLMKNTLKIALNFDISSYDASYLALAEQLKIPFITSDHKLFNKVKSKFIHKLADFNP
jgi:predicted nucleic acid-binding protein